MSNVLFRADANAQIGLGHLMRCLALAEMLGDAFGRRFAIVQPAPEIRQRIEARGLTVVPLASDDVAELLRISEPGEIVVLDGYDFDETYQRAVREAAHKVMFIDDWVAGHQVADVVVNHAGGIRETDYDAEAYTEFCLGPPYALLQPEFLLPAGFGLPPTDGPVFVNLGGADPKNQSLAVLRAVRQANATLPVRIVLGPFHPDRAAIEDFQNQLPLTILQDLDAGQMANEIALCQLAITSCSTVAYEVCAVNRPLIGILTADNQARLAQFLSDEKLALSVNFPELLSRMTPSVGLETALKWAIQSFQFTPENAAETLANQQRYFDGRSPERFRALFDRLRA